ncbi:PTS lactose/cellobiose transporter subunit IIA [Mycoplasmopsis anatis]|nr:PTS lactose/cellobiose transporter subunit IIA [Mycoplasmopsis anatis]
MKKFMDKEINVELIAFELIANSGGAKALFLEALDAAIESNFELAEQKIKEGKQLLQNVHSSHAELLTAEANKQINNIPLLLIHAEDQFMQAESALINAEKTIKIFRKLNSK